MNKNTNIGDINITVDAIATLTGAAVSECYGVVGMASKHLIRDSVAILLRKENYSKGVIVKSTEKGIELDVYVVIMYGVNVIEVANELQKKVKYIVEKTFDIELAAVNVYVQGLKVIE